MEPLANIELPPATEEEKLKIPVVQKLTPEQELLILNTWNSRSEDPPSILELTRKVFGDQHDGRSSGGKLVKEFLASRQVKAKIGETKKEIELTDDQKSYVNQNAKLMKPLALARELFNDPKLSPMSFEYRAVKTQIDAMPAPLKYNNVEDDAIDEAITNNSIYKPPKTAFQAAARVNKYILNCLEPKDVEKNSKVQECLKGTIRFTHMYRFQKIYNSLATGGDKEMFEASYIRFIWDKPDLQEMEVDIVCNLCCDIVNYTRMQKELDDLKRMRDDNLDDSEGRKMSMAMVEEMGNIRKEMNDNHKRQISTTELLEGTRNKRMDLRHKENATLTQLLDFWKTSENRKQLLALAGIRKKKLKDEIQRIESLDDLKAQVWGIHPEELV